MAEADAGASGTTTTDTATPPAAAPAAPAAESGAQPPAAPPAAESDASLLGGDDAGGEGGKQPGDGGVEPADKPGAPESYEEFAMPEGVALNPEVAGEFKAFAKELNLPQDKAQKVADLGAKLVQDVQAKQVQAIQAEIEGWKASAIADQEYGGDKFSENLATANKALTAFGSPELIKTLKESGLGNHPEMIRMLWKMGAAVSEDRFVGGKAGESDAGQGLAQKMYPNMNP